MDRSEIWQLMAADAAVRCSVSTTRDVDTVARRVSHEGESFFNVTLPTFGKDLERSLEEGVIPATLFRGFGRLDSEVTVVPPSGERYVITVRGGGIPKFLSGFMGIVFDARWEVTEEEFQEAGKLAREGLLADCNFFPPVIRAPKDAVEEEGMAEAIHCMRQLTLLFSKEWALPGEDLIQQACEAYVTTDKELDDPF